MAKEILIKPIISEKAEQLKEDLGQYSFVVAKNANKIEIKNAVSEIYKVNVVGVSTLNMPSKSKVRNTRTGVQKGRVSGFKKAVVT
ncbi:UNVERIFIED_CONTAM: hypothetical protein GTU68_047058, partial [Idotea baltica]|nr:hypothetical protein [Idotea baltica]